MAIATTTGTTKLSSKMLVTRSTNAANKAIPSNKNQCNGPPNKIFNKTNNINADTKYPAVPSQVFPK